MTDKRAEPQQRDNAHLRLQITAKDKTIAHLEDENKRLQEALENIARQGSCDNCNHSIMAEQALKGK